MFKRILTGVVLAMVFLTPALAEVRFDLGFNVPLGLGGISSSGTTTVGEATDFLTSHIIPLPHADVYFQMPFDTFRFGGGVRIYTFILESVFWPNVYIEKDVWKFTFVGQAGGGLFGTFGLFNSLQTGRVLIPDVSVWFRAGPSLRLGGGITGLYVPDLLEDGMLMMYYLGLNLALVSR